MARFSFGTFVSIIVTTATAALLTACGTTFMVAADDMYGTMPTREQERRQKLQNQWSQTQSDTDVDYYSDYEAPRNEADTFNYDDYYDYEYSSRLRRFQSDDYLSDDYYSDYYTNSYWYDADPYYYGTSIYLGYNWWYPSYSYYYRPGWYMGFSFGPFGFGWGYRPYYSYYGYGSYSWGYHDGFWDGYWAGRYDRIYDYCYNPYDRNTYTQSYYGRRTRGAGSSVTNPAVSRASTDRRVTTASTASASSTPSLPATGRRTFAERYEQAVGGKSVSTQNSAGTLTGGRTGSTSAGNRIQPAVVNRNTRTPSGLMESVSTRLENKTATGVDRIQPAVPESRRSVNPAADRSLSTSSSSSSSTSVNTATPSRPAQPAQPEVRRGTTSTAVPASQQRNTATSTSSYRGVQPPAATPATRSTQTAQPRQYSNPVYERSRGTSSYVSPQYNSGNRGVRTTSTPVRPAAPTRTSTPARSTTTVRTSSSPARSTSTPARSTSTGSSSGSSSTRRTR